jgi:hypothetical protein
VDRIAFVRDILDGIERRGWPSKPDIGWSEYDVKIFGNRWTHLKLTTVTEDFPKNQQMVRCRLRSAWSLQARAAFWAALGFELLVCGIVGKWLPWLWLLLLTVPLFAWFLAREKRNLQSLMVVFLDELAKKWNFTRVPLREKTGAGPVKQKDSRAN